MKADWTSFVPELGGRWGPTRPWTSGVDLLGACTNETHLEMSKPGQKERHAESGDQEWPGRVWEVIVAGIFGALGGSRTGYRGHALGSFRP